MGCANNCLLGTVFHNYNTLVVFIACKVIEYFNLVISKIMCLSTRSEGLRGPVPFDVW